MYYNGEYLLEYPAFKLFKTILIIQLPIIKGIINLQKNQWGSKLWSKPTGSRFNNKKNQERNFVNFTVRW